MKPTRLSHYAKEQLEFRGCPEKEVIETIRTSHSQWEPAKEGRLECKKNFSYNKEWNNKFYETKQVRPIFAEEENEIVVVTVYVYYF